jgi:hypothetical protein
MSASQEQTEEKKAEAPRDLFGTAFLIWCFLVFGGMSSSGRVSSAYGALTPGAMVGIAALVSGVVAVLLCIFRRKDWRAWAALGFCVLALITLMEKSPHGGGGP